MSFNFIFNFLGFSFILMPPNMSSKRDNFAELLSFNVQRCNALQYALSTFFQSCRMSIIQIWQKFLLQFSIACSNLFTAVRSDDLLSATARPRTTLAPDARRAKSSPATGQLRG